MLHATQTYKANVAMSSSHLDVCVVCSITLLAYTSIFFK
jgi:hypothetical protein